MQAMESDFTPMSDVRAGAYYRMQVAKNLLFKAFLESDNKGGAINIQGERG